MVKESMGETSKGQKYTAYEVGNFFEYEKALTNLENLKVQEARLLLNQGTYSDDEWQRKIDEIVATEEQQEKLIEQYIREMPDRSLKCLGRNIKILMKQSGMKISDLEDKLGVSAGYLSRTLNEDSKKRISVDIVWKIALVFNVNIDDLINVDLGAPTKEILTVKDFIKKLRKDTDNGVTPILRAYEFYLHRVLGDKMGLSTSDANGKNNFAYFNKNASGRYECNSNKTSLLTSAQQVFLDDLYNAYHSVRHPYSHWSADDYDTAVITTIEKAVEHLVNGLTLVDKYYILF